MKLKHLLFFNSILLIVSACASVNKLSKKEEKAGWKLLFDGQTTAGWHNYNKQGPVEGWAVQNGEFVALGASHSGGNDIVSDGEYENFELSLEWKISPGGNSGVFYNVVEKPEYAAVYATGPEYQLIDDVGFPSKLEDWQKTAANYAMHPPAVSAAKPVGQYNHTKILVNKGHVIHWLNGQKIVEYQLWTPEWDRAVKTGKWKDFPAYGRAKRGRIGLQDHGAQTWFRNVKIREL